MKVDHRVPLAPLTTLGFGGPAAVVAQLRDRAEFADVVALGRESGRVPVFVGGGSNIVVADAGCPDPVVLVRTTGITRRAGQTPGTVELTVAAGHPLQDLIDLTISEGLSGLETMTGIPGTVGAAPVQNVGAYGQEIGDTIGAIDAWDWQRGRQVRLTRSDCGFGHRTSIFKRSRRWTVLSVTLLVRVSPLSDPVTYPLVARTLGVELGARVPVAELAQAVLAVRDAKGMVLSPDNPDNRSAGSVFLSPLVGKETAAQLRREQAPVHEFSDGTVRVSASWLIKESGLRLGQLLDDGVRMSSRQYTLVADEGATARSFASATRLVMRQVREVTNVRLIPELDAIPHCHDNWPDRL